MSRGGRLSSAYLLGRTNNRFSRAYTRVCIRDCFFGVCTDACTRRDPFVTGGQVYVSVCTRGHRCFERWWRKYHSRKEDTEPSVPVFCPPLSNYIYIYIYLSSPLGRIIKALFVCDFIPDWMLLWRGRRKIVSKFDGFIIGGKSSTSAFFSRMKEGILIAINLQVGSKFL